MTKYTFFWLFSVCLKTRGSKKRQSKVAGNDIIFGEKALAFLTKPTATTPLGSGFPLPWTCSSLFQTYLYFSFSIECVPLDTVSVFFHLKHILNPSIKHFKLHQLPSGKWPTSSKACLNTWKIASCFEKSAILQKFFAYRHVEIHSFFSLWTRLFFKA